MERVLRWLAGAFAVVLLLAVRWTWKAVFALFSWLWTAGQRAWFGQSSKGRLVWGALASTMAVFIVAMAVVMSLAPDRGYQASLTSRVKQIILPPPTQANLGDELDCLAHNVYFEARGEPDEGMVAVAHVVMNRVADKRFPDTVCGVVRQGGEAVRHRCQFSWWCDGKSDEPTEPRAWAVSQAVAHRAYWSESRDPTDGALWYHAIEVKPVWRKALVEGPRIGDHIFYLSPKDKTQVASRPATSQD